MTPLATPARLLLLATAFAGAAAWAPEARALTSFQTSSPSLFTLQGSTTSTGTLNFNRFNPDVVGDDKKNITLIGYNYILTDVVASGTVVLGNPTTVPKAGPFDSQVALSFSPLQAGSSVAFTPVSATSPGPLAPGFTAKSITGSANNLVAPTPFINISNPANFVSPPGTPRPGLTGYSASWAYISPPGVLSDYTNAIVSGRISVQWQYSYEIQEVPAPLPLAGAGLAFAWSRGLRRRTRAAA